MKDSAVQFWMNASRVSFFGMCGQHAMYRRHYCAEKRESFCEMCHPYRPGVRMYRYMYCDVVAKCIDDEFEDVQTFQANGRKVLHLRPFKKVNPLSAAQCVCGRGTKEHTKFCSIQCMITAFSVRKQARKRRKISVPRRSPEC